MKNKKVDSKRGGNNFLSVGIILITLLIFLIILSVGAQEGGGGGNETLQQELDNLTQYLTEQGYEWLVDYNIENDTNAEIGVYNENIVTVILNLNIGAENETRN